MRKFATSVLQHLICLFTCTIPAGLVLGVVSGILLSLGVPAAYFTEFGGGIPTLLVAFGSSAFFYYLILKFIRKNRSN